MNSFLLIFGSYTIFGLLVYLAVTYCDTFHRLAAILTRLP